MAFRTLIRGVFLCVTCENPTRVYFAEEAWEHGDTNRGHTLRAMRLYAYKRELKGAPR